MALVTGPTRANVRLPAVFGDHMVLQRGRPVPVWGRAEPGARVTVAIKGHRVSTAADADGRWRVCLPRMRAGGPYEMTVTGRTTITLRNVAVGEVWVASGQSNMEWNVAWETLNYEAEIAAGDHPMIRMFTVEKAVAGEPQADLKGLWEPASPQTVGRFSAVGYYFARELHQKLGVPVGILHASWGGTPAEAWTSVPAMNADPELKILPDRWAGRIARFEDPVENARLRAEWSDAVERARAEGSPPPPPPEDPRLSPWRPGGLYNAMIAPLVPYGIRGAIWYQGESNVDRAYQYRTLFPALIRDWRRAWGQGEFPFLFVQLAGFMPRRPEPGEDAWAELREAQLMALSLPKTGMASAVDLGDTADIHPRNKQDVGRRLAWAALKIAYGKASPVSGPLYRSMKVEGNRIRLRFRHTDGGLVVKGNAPMEGFAVAGGDRRFVPADAVIEGDTVVVWSDRAPNPVAVRYGWESHPPSSLYNGAGLPASPFRTDDWPGITVNNK